MLAVVLGLSVLVGVSLGLLGGGGSILTVPILLYVAGLPAKEAIAASLFVVGVTSAVGAVSHARAGRVRWPTGLLFGTAGMAGAYAGGRVGAYVPGSWLLAGFGVMMLATAVAMLRGRPAAATGTVPRAAPVVRVLAQGSVVGLVAGLVGAGGGFLVVPALVLLGGLPMPAAVGTSLVVIALQSAAGFAGHLHSASIDWPLLLAVTAAAVAGGVIGGRLAGRIRPAALRRAFGWFVLAMAAVVLTEQAPAAARLPVLGACAAVGLAAVPVLRARRPAGRQDGASQRKPDQETGARRPMLEIVPIDTPTLGDRSYLVHDGTVALVVDPQRDIDRVLDLAGQAGVRITHVFETHIHNDYVTGGYALAAATGAAYHVNAADPVSYDRVPVGEGDVIDVGPALRVRVLATPGHTFTHLSYALEAGGRPVGVFTGGSLLYGSTGRPDLLGPDHTGTLVRAQHRSAHRLATELPDSAAVYPTHGFGSFCSATQSDAAASTIGQEKQANPALTTGEDDFVAALLAGLDAWPAYYAHMAPANLAGPAAPDLSPPAHADPDELRRRIDAGEWVVDLRSRTAFAAGHLPRSLSFGLDGSFATYLGWLIPWGTPLTLLGETTEQIAEAQRELVRIGIDRPAAAATGTPQAWAGGTGLATLRTATFTDLAAARQAHDAPVVVLDVRRNLEWADGHILGATHIPLHELLNRLEDIPTGQVWVHCRSGYRASLAASLLVAHGRDVVAVDDEFGNAGARGVRLAA